MILKIYILFVDVKRVLEKIKCKFSSNMRLLIDKKVHFLSNDLSFNSFGSGDKNKQYKSLSAHIDTNIT